ncbi:endoplasmic reticulum transmembrane protein 1 [[Candida] jaroonii]|uniref:Endoplasmic reticulum transmembrane protein 1 n=1 Tax=[Candida] jaroonii TaxID=467808 RepID=A0ACA9YEP6_9ASCO|nr:endoplasmic reticulum transmembrane protein 1 [[Candida] jaroonii]
MSIQMNLVFITLCVEMATLFMMVLPLPHILRRKFIHLIEILQKSQNFKVGLIFFTIILGLQFMDCVNRLNRLDYLRTPYFTMSNMSSNTMLTNDQLASKFYSQRNLYLSGAVLYLELAIYTVITHLKKLVAKEDKLRSLNVKQTFASEDEEVAKYKQLIEAKEKDISVMKKQIEGIQRSYDELNPSSGISKSD